MTLSVEMISRIKKSVTKRILDSLEFDGNGSSFCLCGQKTLKLSKLAFTPKRGLIWTQDPDGPSFPFGGHINISPNP